MTVREGPSVTPDPPQSESSAWGQIVGSLSPKVGTVHLPRFRMGWGRDLKEDLKAMGMEVPFIKGQADFSWLSDEAIQQGLFITKVKHKTFADVNEEGTEAAGVTSVVLST